MKKYIIGFLGGLFVTTSACVVVLPLVLEDKFKFGHGTGFADGLSAVADELEQHYGLYTEADGPYEIVYDIKTTRVVIIDVNGVKSIKVIK
jgi:hypothetical protein